MTPNRNITNSCSSSPRTPTPPNSTNGSTRLRPSTRPPPVGAIEIPPTTTATAIAGATARNMPVLARQLSQRTNHNVPSNPVVGAHVPNANPFANSVNVLAHQNSSLSAAAAHLMAQTLSPLAAVPAGEGRIMARNINGTCKCEIYLFIPVFDIIYNYCTCRLYII